MRPRAGIVGFALVMAASTACNSDHAEPKTRGEVFMKLEATPKEVRAVRTALQQNKAAHDVRFIGRRAAFRIATEIFKDSPDILTSISPANVPESFRFTTGRRQEALGLRTALRALPGVDEIMLSLSEAQIRNTLKDMLSWCFEKLPRSDAVIFMKLNSNPSDLRVVDVALRSSNRVSSVVRLGLDDALHALIPNRRGRKGSLAPEITTSDVPESLWVRLRHPDRPNSFLREVRDLPGVDQVILNECPRL